MSSQWVTRRAVLSLLLVAVVFASCDFRNKGLTEVPDLSASTDCTELDLGHNQITAIPAGVFDNLTSLEYLYLYSNQITAIPAGVFDNLTSLQLLSLYYNQITAMPIEVFDGLTALQVLFLHDNEITAIPAGVFDGLTALQTLSLSTNKITAIPAGVFDGLTSLQYLNLGGNKITAIPAGVFDGLTSLQYLALSGGTGVPDVFNNLPSLQVLHLNNRQITAIPAGVFDGLTSLQELGLYNNEITAIPAGMFDNLTSLQELSLYNNQITAIPAGVFDGLTSLQGLSLHNNLLWDNMFTNGTLLEATIYATPATSVRHDCIMSAPTQTNSCSNDCDSSLAAFTRSPIPFPAVTLPYDWIVANEAPVVELVEAPAAFSGDSTPLFVVRAVWPSGSLRNGTEPLAVIQVDEGEGFQSLCDGTSSAGGVCVWNLTLAEPQLKTVAFRAVFGEENGVGLTHTWRYTLCDDSHYAVIGDNFAITCEPCPSGGDCAGGLTQLDNIVAAEGFWTPPDAIIFYECPLDGACIPGGSVTIGNTTSFSRHRCAAGHTGTLCAVCDDGYFQQFGRCVKCGGGKGAAWLIMLVLVLVVAAVGALFFRFKEVLPVDQLKVALSFLQIIASANTAYSIPWPPLFVGFLDTARVFLVEVVSLTRANCAQPMSYFSSLTVTLVGFKIITVAIVVGPVLVTKWKARRAAPESPPPPPAPAPAPGDREHRRQRRLSRRMSVVLTAAVAKAVQVDWSKVFKVAFLFLFVAYPSISLKIMLLFKCVEVEGVPWLVADMRLECYTGEWYGYATYAVIMGVVYTAGLPLVIAGILWKNRKRLQEAATLQRWGFLYEVYGAEAYMWEVEELVRKLILSALVVLINDGNPLQIALAVFVSGWAHVLHSMYKPWRGAGVDGDYTYVLQHMTLFVTAFVFLMGLLFKVEGIAQGTPTFDALAWILLLLCVGVVVAAVVLLVHCTRVKVRTRRVGKTLGASAEGVADGSTTGDVVAAWTGSGGAGGRARKASNLNWTSNPLKR